MPGPLDLTNLLERLQASLPAANQGSGGIDISGYGEDPYNWTPDEVSDFIYQAFASAGLSPSDADFAVRVAQGESGLNVHGADGAAGEKGIWQLLPERGLLPEFYSWATSQEGIEADPYNPVSTTLYVAQKIASEGPQAWGNWSAANALVERGVAPPDLAQSAGRTQFPSEAEADYAGAERARAEAALTRDAVVTQQQNRELALMQMLLEKQQAEEEKKQNAFERVRDKQTLLQTTQQLADARREAVVQAMLQAAPFMVSESTRYTPGLEPSGAGSQLGRMLGVNVPAQEMPRQTLPLNAMLNAPQPVTPETIGRDLSPFM